MFLEEQEKVFHFLTAGAFFAAFLAGDFLAALGLTTFGLAALTTLGFFALTALGLAAAFLGAAAAATLGLAASLAGFLATAFFLGVLTFLATAFLGVAAFFLGVLTFLAAAFFGAFLAFSTTLKRPEAPAPEVLLIEPFLRPFFRAT